MKKTLSINLNGRVFNIDEDAYALLENYLKNLKTYFSKELGSAEIMNDFEERIGEIFSAKISQGYDVISIDYVEQTIAQLGRPSDFDQTREKESAFKHFETGSGGNAQSEAGQPSKKLFRDPQNKIFGGVCSGLAAYLGWDVTWVRLAAVGLFFIGLPLMDAFVMPGWLIILYIALWIIVPAAQNAEQRLKMTGEPVTLENIGKTVAAQANSAAPANSDSNNSGASAVLKFCLIVIACFTGIPLLFALGIVLVALFAVTLGVGTGVLGGLIPFTSDTFLLVTRPEMATAGACIFIGIPLFVLIYSIVSAIFKWKPANRWIKVSGLVIWIASIFLLLGAGWKADWQQLKNKNQWHIGWGDSHPDGRTLNGNGAIEEKTFNFSQNVNKIVLERSINIDLQIDSVKSNATELTMQTDENLIEFIDINVRGTTLTVRPKRRYYLVPSAPIVIKLKINELNGIDLSGASTLNISNAFTTNKLDVDVSGASHLTIADITAHSIVCETSGASEADFSGTANTFNAEASGASSISADRLIAADVVADASGASSIHCAPTNSLSAEASGVSSVTYTGEPKSVSKDVSGMSSVEKH
ncbi:MAG: DUF2807 domain-containing protein [Prevotellaceae bacterium]|jgi:phage shock protein PspC (stress-responsive transcriptional regulator)|nr:DUF2807 domain-containing protein [Prevotellaceae bacterium]